jgi:hypothetical protein
MNDRIRELYRQAHSIRHHDGDPIHEGNPPTVYWQGEVSAEKFAELIIEQCGIVGDNWVDNEDDGKNRISDKFKEHFGVDK